MMLCYVMLCYIRFYYYVMFCFVILLYHIISYYNILYHIILYHIISYYIILYYIISYHIILYYIILHYIIYFLFIMYIYMYALTHFRMIFHHVLNAPQVGARWEVRLELPLAGHCQGLGKTWEDPWENDGKNGESHGSMEVYSWKTCSSHLQMIFRKSL